MAISEKENYLLGGTFLQWDTNVEGLWKPWRKKVDVVFLSSQFSP